MDEPNNVPCPATGDEIEQLMTDADLNQTQLAERMKISQSEVSRLEGRASLDDTSKLTLHRLATALGVRFVIG